MGFNFRGLTDFTTQHAYTVFLFTVFFAAGIITYLIASIKDSNRFSIRDLFFHVFPKEAWSHSTKADLCIYAISKFTQRWVAALSTAVTVIGATLGAKHLGTLFSLQSHFEATSLDWAILGTSFFLFIDLGQYISHRIQHKIPLLWEFHKVHHSATVLTPLTSFRFHPVGNAIDGLFLGLFLAVPVTVAELLYGLSVVDLLAIAGTANVVANVIVLDALHHTQFRISFGPLDRIVMSPGMHQVHHSTKRKHWGKNYGARLSLWDWCFGTHINVPKEPMTYGMGAADDESAHYHSLLWCYIEPFINSWNMAKPAITSTRLLFNASLRSQGPAKGRNYSPVDEGS